MKVYELIDELKAYDPNMQVVIQASNSMYCDWTSHCERNTLRAFFGDDKEVIVIKSDEQAGSI